MRIEAGKYYRTRDGQKVGPMIYKPYGDYDPWEVKGVADLWKDNGRSDSGDKDLIAEWTDEPPHFTHMLAEMQDLAENYGYTIGNVSTDTQNISIHFTLTN